MAKLGTIKLLKAQAKWQDQSSSLSLPLMNYETNRVSHLKDPDNQRDNLYNKICFKFWIFAKILVQNLSLYCQKKTRI